jgi:hypothetical protein
LPVLLLLQLLLLPLVVEGGVAARLVQGVEAGSLKAVRWRLVAVGI